MESDEILSRNLVLNLKILKFVIFNRFSQFLNHRTIYQVTCSDTLFLTSTLRNWRSKINRLVSIIRTDRKEIHPEELESGKKSIRTFI